MLIYHCRPLCIDKLPFYFQTLASDSSASTVETRISDYIDRVSCTRGALPVGGSAQATTRYLTDFQLENADARHPANVPMLIVRGYTPTPRRATQGHATVDAGAVVNALYKLAEWLFVRTADDAVGFIPRACVQAIGPRTARDFGQQFPERNADGEVAKRGRDLFSPRTTTPVSSDGEGASDDDSGTSLRDEFEFLNMRKRTPSPSKAKQSRRIDGLNGHQQTKVALGNTSTSDEGCYLTRANNTVDIAGVTYMRVPTPTAKKSKQSNDFPKRQREHPPSNEPKRRACEVVARDVNGSRRRLRYRENDNYSTVAYCGSKSAGDVNDDSFSDDTETRSLCEAALEYADNCSLCHSRFVNAREPHQDKSHILRGCSSGSDSRRPYRHHTDLEHSEGLVDSDHASNSDHSAVGHETDYRQSVPETDHKPLDSDSDRRNNKDRSRRRDRSHHNEQKPRGDPEQCNGDNPPNNEDEPRIDPRVRRDGHRSGSRSRRRSASGSRRATLTVVFAHVSQTDGDIDVARGETVRLLSDADAQCYWVRRESDGRRGFIPKSCAVNLREFNLDPSTRTTYL